jgi:amidase
MSGFEEYRDYDGLGLAALVRSEEVSPGELLDAAIARTEAVNGELNAVVHRHYEAARAAIAQGLPEGPFTGVPFLLKDLYAALAGTTTTNGSGMFGQEAAQANTTLVERYRQAGLVIFGKTNSPELGLMPVTEPKRYGPSRNPWDTQRTPGGSSGGASSAVAAGIVPLAHASDGGGSIRIPASCTGLVGLKPSRGRTPSGPLKAEGWGGQSISHVVSRTVRDSAAMLDATAGSEVGEAYAAPAHSGSFLDCVARAPGSLRIAVSREKWGRGQYQPEVLAGLERTISLLQDLGHQVEEARPEYDAEATASALFTVISANTALAVRQQAAQLGCTIAQLDMEEGTRFTAQLGDSVSGADYVQAIQTNQLAGRILGDFHDRYDVILAPTLASEPVPVGHIGEAAPDEYAERLFAFMGDTGLYNQTGQPSVSLPLHWSSNNLPVGMMFTAAYGNDGLLLQLSGQLELACPWAERRAPL